MDEPLLVHASSAPTPSRARLTKAQKTEINRQAHAAALLFEQEERKRLTESALQALNAREKE